MAVANAESRDRLRQMAYQQAALRRVATRVAEGAPPGVVLATVAEEVARILDVSSVTVVRYEPDHAARVLATFNDRTLPIGSRWPLDGPDLFSAVLATERPARVEDYAELPGPVAAAARASGLESGFAVPIVVDGAVWGAVAIGRRRRRDALPRFAGSYTGRLVLGAESAPDVEARLAAFTELAATAISNAQAHDDLQRLAEEQAALRRVATLVAEAVPAARIFDAVVAEVARILRLQGIEMARYDADGTATVIAGSGDHPSPAGKRWPLDGPSIMASVFETGRPARIDDYGAVDGPVAANARRAGMRSAIGAPIVVDGSTWGVVIAFSSLPDRIPDRSGVRLNAFTALVATAVSNATARAELIASRARIVVAGDEARRRLERNLHDGTQQRLLALGLDLQRIRASVRDDPDAADAGLEQATRDLETMLEDVRELSRGLHPARLTRSGLAVALRALARKSPIPVDVDVDVRERPPATVETAVYYVVSEALTNAIKHSAASAVAVTIGSDGATMRAKVHDDGAGGATAAGGSGLVGMKDRVDALGGRFALDSPRGGGTTIAIELPLIP
jgi:signal transduction histidine kinase